MTANRALGLLKQIRFDLHILAGDIQPEPWGNPAAFWLEDASNKLVDIEATIRLLSGRSIEVTE